MRKSLLFGLLFLVASCSVQKEKDFEGQGRRRYHAVVEEPDGEETRVYADSRLRVHWNEGDRISIFERNTYNREFEFLGDTGDTAGDFDPVESSGSYHTGGDIEDGLVYAVYPYEKKNKCDYDGTLTVTFPSTQHYKKDSFGIGANIMIARTNSMDLRFMHVGGYRTVRLYGAGVSVSAIKIESNGPEYLSGRTDVTIGQDGAFSVDFIESSSNSKAVELVCDTPVALGSTAEEYVEFWFVLPPGTLTQGFTITITDTNGNVYTKSTFNAIEIQSGVKKNMPAFEVVIANEPEIPVPEAVDLGLPSGLKWASFNLGASSPEEYGDYYAWGETEPYYSGQDPLTWKDGKSGYDTDSYRWCMGSLYTMTKYCTDSFYGYEGFTDGKTVLDLEDDAASVNLSGSWRIPIFAEWTELMNNCTWTWTTQNGVNGMLVSANNGNSIFLPAAGYSSEAALFCHAGTVGNYWSSSLLTDYSRDALGVEFYSTAVSGCSDHRYLGLSVRPVYGAPTVSVIGVSLDKTSLLMAVGDTQTLNATVTPSNATYKTVTWSSSNPSVATVSSSGVVTGISAGNATVTVTTIDGGKTATCSVTVTEPNTVATPEAVDLGLSVKWASFNLGATSPAEFGDYYAWGETSTKEYFNSSNYKFYPNGDSYTVSKYIVPDQYGYNAWGTPDYNNVLDPEDDAASVILGEGWRIPTMDDFQELLDNCSWIPYESNGVKGYLVISNVDGYTDKSIFLPADVSMDGDGIYWTSVLCSKSHGGIGLADSAGTFDVMRSPTNDYYGFIGRFRGRDDGYFIRPVHGKPAKDAVEVISCIPPSLTIHVGEEVQLSATVLPFDAEYDGFNWNVSGGTPYISVTNNGTVKGLRKGNGHVEARIGYVYSGCSVTILDSAEPANCHILRTGSETYIQTVKGNSATSVGNVASAEVLWETFNSDIEPAKGDIIETIKLKGGVLYVKSGNQEGNAVIAVKDTNGLILWSWHIWVTNQSIHEVTYSNNAGVLMDRNLGSINDCGLLFQWGRKDPFPHNYRSAIDDFASTITWPSNVTSNVGGTISYSISHPTTLIQNNTVFPLYSSDWLSDTNNSLWGEEKTIYDPCPAGWKVPKGGPEGVWVIAGFPTYDVTSSGSAPNESPYNTYSPTSGSEDTRSAYYWSSTAYDSNNSYGLYRSWFWSDDGDADHFSMNPSARLSKQSLGAVRCIKDNL